jgi:hypothetical protein
VTAPEWVTAAAATTPTDAARIAAEGEQARLNATTAMELRRQQAQLDRDQRIQDAQDKRDRKASRRDARAQRAAQVRTIIRACGRRGLIVGPIVAPMAVAWIGQIQFATGTLSWPLAGAFVFAAGWELTTAFSGWMYHQARQAGDRGTVFRAATWLFAASAGAMNYWHASTGGWNHPTPKAVSYGAMSLVGIALWELYASLIHRQEMRARDAIPPARPRFGAVHWVRYPYLTWTAWSLSVRDGITSAGDALNAAKVDVAEKRARKTTGRTTSAPMVPEVDATTPAPVVQTITAPVVGTTSAPMVQTTAEPVRETTAAPMGATTAEPAAETILEPTRRTTRKTTGKGGAKPARRTREQLREEIERKVAQHYESGGGEIQVKPLADELKANRATVRQLLDEMNVRPIRKATG